MDLEHLGIIVLALGAGALAKGATGMGLPLIAMPVLTVFVGLQHAISIMIIPLVATNFYQVVRFRNEHARPELRFLVPLMIGGLLGIAGGTWVLVRIDERFVKIALGAVLLGYVAFRLVRPDIILGTIAGRRIAAFIGLAAGILQGSTGVSSPVVATFIHSMKLGYASHVFAVSAAFLMLSAVQFPALILSGILEWPWLLESIFALLPIMCLMPVGQLVGNRLSRSAFDKLILVFLAVIGLKFLGSLWE